jgi:rubrerythrin
MTVNEILDFAIKEEENAANFYKELAEKMKREWMKQAFLDFAKEEMKHKAILLKIKKGNTIKTVPQKILDLKIVENLKREMVITDDLDYREALLIAMKAEKEAYLLYSLLANRAEDKETKELLTMLANEEAKHKLKFETEYDDLVFQEN